MAEETTEIKGTPVEEESSESEEKPKFLLLGKYFLFVLVFVVQLFLAYTIVDKNYEQVYQLLHKNEPEAFATYQMDELVVNPAETNGKRYLLVEISLELDDEDHISLLQSNDMKLKQSMIEALSERTISELTTSEGREVLRYDLIGIINQSIGTRSVRNLYFTKYVMQ